MCCICSSCKDAVSFHSSSLATLAAFPVAILVGVPERRGGVRIRDPSTNFGRGGGWGGVNP